MKNETSVNWKKDKSVTFDNQFEVLAALPKVGSSLNGNITEDYTLAKLGEAEKVFIIENYGNAEFAKKLLGDYATTPCYPIWDDEKKTYLMNKDGSVIYKSIEDLDKDAAERIKAMSNRIFEFFMVRPDLIAVLNRNRDDNFLVKLLGNYQEEKSEELELASMADKVKERLAGNEMKGGTKEE